MLASWTSNQRPGKRYSESFPIPNALVVLKLPQSYAKNSGFLHGTITRVTKYIGTIKSGQTYYETANTAFLASLRIYWAYSGSVLTGRVSQNKFTIRFPKPYPRGSSLLKTRHSVISLIPRRN